MKSLNLCFELNGLELQGSDKGKSAVELSAEIIKQIMAGYINTLVEKRVPCEEERRKYYKVCDCLKETLELKLGVLELEDDWMGQLRKSFRDCPFRPNDLVRKVEENVWAVECR